MANFVALYDACVLYPAPLRDLLLHLALTDLFKARWTDRIHEEWIRSVLANRPDLTPELLDRTRLLMNRAVPDCLVTEYEGLIERLELPDPDDRHVLAAAIRCQAGVIVTYNLKDFPEHCLARYGIEALHPDEFIAHQFDLSPAKVGKAVRDQRQSLRNPPQSARQLLDTFLSLGLASTVSALESMQELL
jgi:predicted nucleic acid-binding protein